MKNLKIKIITLLFILIAITANTEISAQNKLKFRFDNITLKELFNQIQAQTGYKVLYDQNNFDDSRCLSITTEDETIETTMSALLRNSGFTHVINDKHIFVTEIESNYNKITGIVLDRNTGEPIRGASISLLTNTDNNEKSNLSGMFTLKHLQSERSYTIKITKPDYKTEYRSMFISRKTPNCVVIRILDRNSRNQSDLTKQKETNNVTIVYKDNKQQKQVVDLRTEEPENLEPSTSIKETQVISKQRVVKPTHLNNEKEIKPTTNRPAKRTTRQDINDFQPVLGFKTNLLWWGTTSPNMAIEVALSKKLSLDIFGSYNPFTKESDQLKHLFIQPELRYWINRPMRGHFFGIHGTYADYNVGMLDFPDSMKNLSYKGHLYGGGISYGYYVPFNKWLGMEFTLGVGYIQMQYDKYECLNCDVNIGKFKRSYIGPTKAGVALVFNINK